MGEWDVRLDGDEDQEIFQDLLVIELKRIRKYGGPEKYKARRDKETQLYANQGNPINNQGNKKKPSPINNPRDIPARQDVRQEVVPYIPQVIKGRDANKWAPFKGMKIGANIDRGLAWLETFLLGVVAPITLAMLYFLYIFIEEWYHTSHGMMYWYQGGK